MGTTRVSQSQFSGLETWQFIHTVAMFIPPVQRSLECLKLTHDLFLKWTIFPTDYSIIIQLFEALLTNRLTENVAYSSHRKAKAEHISILETSVVRDIRLSSGV